MKAIILNATAWMIVPVMDAIAKHLSLTMDVFQITWARYFFTVVFTLSLMVLFYRETLVWSKRPKLQLVRGIILAFSTLCFFYSISVISLPKALTLAFVAPITCTALSPFFLGEKVGIRRWSAVLVGFVGVLIVSRPGTIHFTMSYLGLFVSAFLIAINIALVRKFSKNHSSISFTFYAFLSAAIINGLLAMNNYMIMTFNDTMILVLCGIICGVGGNFLTMASKNLESSVFAPIQSVSYTHLTLPTILLV